MKSESLFSGGLVLRGSRNIFTVRSGAEQSVQNEIECRIKGKVLKIAEDHYNPIAPGDLVKIELNPAHPGTGMIVGLEERENFFSRFNQKGNCPQLLAANVDMVLCMTSRQSPPFRPRFLDRVLLQADSAGIPALIVCNKIDLDSDDSNDDRLDADERLEDFRRIGFELAFISTKTGEGVDDLRRRLEGKRSVLIGQSGVGKSSLINALMPEINLRTGKINEKYDRGNHTTTLSAMVEIKGDTWIIDTPGIRRFIPNGISAEELIMNMREFAPLAGKCSFGLSCSHRSEPGCKIMEAVTAGVIHEDRYSSFLRIHDELSGKNDAD
ncbi:MAG: ribosome small subunit-dependent GTPase A [Treponema sp.]|jgi:ribosome biogenesis GTPase|nr:ribosome small subunit-dependent GTPase A [Treponema sp.]